VKWGCFASNDQGGRVDRESNHFYTSVLPTGNLREFESPVHRKQPQIFSRRENDP
jgi:hypothetical protein